MAIIKLQGDAERRKGIYYEVDSSQEPIGEGGTGKVFEGLCVNEHTGETRPVAIKFMFSDLSEQIVERARREASIQLRNDNLVEMLGFIETETYQGNRLTKHYHVVSELLHGVMLADLFNGRCVDAKGREVPYAKKLLNIFIKDPDHFTKVIMLNVLSGLMALHDAGYIHRDIDPSNIMITDDGHIKLIDFGICKQMGKLTTHDRELTTVGMFMGKPEYAAPELVLGDLKHQDQTTDIYAVGILMFQCLLGHVPFEGKKLDVLNKQQTVPVPVKMIKNVRLRRIVEKACQKKQELRYQTSAEMRVDIESLDVKRAADPRKRRMAIIAGACLALVVVATVAGIGMYRTHKEAQAAALIEKNRTDSLMQVIDISLQQARTQAQKGYLHDEGFDQNLVAAMRLFSKADAARAELTDPSTAPDYDGDKQKLFNALKDAHDELELKAQALADDPDSAVVEEVRNIFGRVKEIEEVLKK